MTEASKHVSGGFFEYTLTWELTADEETTLRELQSAHPGWDITVGIEGTWHAQPRIELEPGNTWFHPRCTGPGTEGIHPAAQLNAGTAAELAAAVKRAPVTHPARGDRET